MKYDDMQKLEELRANGTLSEEEYQREKEKILNAPNLQSFIDGSDGKVLGMDSNTYCLLMHLSQLVVTIIVPIVLWVIAKDKSPMIDAQGKIILNWFLSALIYLIVFAFASLILVGIPFLMATAICMIVFPIIAAVKASKGETWKYPLSIPFFAV